MENKDIKDTLNIFQMIMLDMLRRQAVMEVFEARAIIGKVAKDNIALYIYVSDYLRAQFSDLRKFFETDDNSHRIIDLTTLLPYGPTKNMHKHLFDVWKKDYQNTTNKYFFHREKEYKPPTGFSKNILNSFISEVISFIDILIKELTSLGYTTQYIVRDSDYIKDIKIQTENLFDKI